MFDEVLKANLTQSELASLFKVSRVTINNWLTGKCKPHMLAAPRVHKVISLIEAAVANNKLPLPDGINRTLRGKEIAAAITASIKAPA